MNGVRETLWRVRPASLLSRGDWIYLLSLLIPIFAYDVVLKILRVLDRHVSSPLLFADLIRSEVLFNLGYAALWIGLFAIARRGFPRWIVLVLFHVSAIIVTALSTVAHFYYLTTGSPFSLSLISFSFSSFGETQAVIASETTTLDWLLLSIVLFYAIAGPALVTRLFTREWQVPAYNDGNLRLASAVPCAMAVVLIALAFLPSATGASSSFSRDSVVNMVATEVEVASGPQVDVHLTSADMPTHTKLVNTSHTKKRNVVLIFLESTRARSTTPYNPDINTTPYLDKLAKDSLVADRSYAVVPHTSKALVAATCGVAPSLSSDVIEAKPNGIPARCLPDLLKDKGYSTEFFQSATEHFEDRRDLVANFGYDGFWPVDYMDKTGFQEVNYFGYEDDIMLQPSHDWLKQHKDGPFLASYLTVTTHHDYGKVDRYGQKHFSNNDRLNRYLNDVRYEDFFIKKLIRQYKDMGLYKNTVFVILGDHGEGFGEHGRYQHDDVIWNEGLHMPLIIHDPQSNKRGHIKPPVNEMDILPTVAKLLGYKIRGGTYPGASVLDPPKNRTLMASCYHEDRCLASIKGDQKYIYHYGTQRDQWFDLSKDPNEEHNLADQHEKEIKHRRKELLAWQAKINATYNRQLAKQQAREETTLETTTDESVAEETTAAP